MYVAYNERQRKFIISATFSYRIEIIWPLNDSRTILFILLKHLRLFLSHKNSSDTSHSVSLFSGWVAAHYSGFPVSSPNP
jgi:hypothetical protein